MKIIGNILWFTIGLGFLTGTAWVILGAIAYISVIGIPWGRSSPESLEFEKRNPARKIVLAKKFHKTEVPNEEQDKRTMGTCLLCNR